jgi:hypothetical protein
MLVLRSALCAVAMAVMATGAPRFVLAAPASVRINELNANITGGCDLVELRVMASGSMQGFQLWQRTTSILTFGALTVATNDIIIVHVNSASATCNPANSGNETSNKGEFPGFIYPANYDDAWDWYSTSTSLTNTDNVFTLYDDSGVIMDAVLAANAATGTVSAASESQASVVAADGQWTMVGGGVPAGGFVDDDFRAHAVLDLDATGTAKSGPSIARIDNSDTQTKADWNGTQAQSWSFLNPGQSVVAVDVERESSGRIRLRAAPTIGNGSVHFTLERPVEGRAVLVVHDVSGRPIWRMTLAHGAMTASWDGRGIAGPVRPGLYWARLKETRGTAVARLVRF